jgi:hypothetical protein
VQNIEKATPLVPANALRGTDPRVGFEIGQALLLCHGPQLLSLGRLRLRSLPLSGIPPGPVTTTTTSKHDRHKSLSGTGKQAASGQEWILLKPSCWRGKTMTGAAPWGRLRSCSLRRTEELLPEED